MCVGGVGFYGRERRFDFRIWDLREERGMDQRKMGRDEEGEPALTTDLRKACSFAGKARSF